MGKNAILFYPVPLTYMSYASFNNVKNVAFDKKNNTNQINKNKNTETLKNVKPTQDFEQF